MDVAEMFRECELESGLRIPYPAENVSWKEGLSLLQRMRTEKTAVYQMWYFKGFNGLFSKSQPFYSKKAMENYRSNGIHTEIRKSLIAGSIEQGRRSLPDLVEGEQGWLRKN